MISGSVMAFIVTFLLPPVNSSIYFYPESPISTNKYNYKTFDNQCPKVNNKKSKIIPKDT